MEIDIKLTRYDLWNCYINSFTRRKVLIWGPLIMVIIIGLMGGELSL